MTAISLCMAHTRLIQLSRTSAPERVVRFLLDMTERLSGSHPTVLDLPMSRSDIADYLGMTIETVCRVLAHLRREGTVAIDRSRITIHDEVALQQMASEPRH